MSESISQAKRDIVKWYSIWIVLQVGLLLFGTDFPWWIRYIPGIVIVLSLIVSALAIIISRNKFRQRTAIIKGKTIHDCLHCRYRQAKDNPLPTGIPIIHCGADPGLPLVLNPRHIPRWCTYASH